MSEQIKWEPKAFEKYQKMLSKIPLFHRELTKQVVDRQAPLNAKSRSAGQVEEPDIICAFLAEVPMQFYSLMIRLMDEVGFDYRKYEVKK
ncbi:MAG: hypothetical protein HQL27_05710 [Candidatus Omnitrophica bacterium]|nr:hypothetical protein [Candidatus Omnitrophota bacterium]